MTHMDKQAAHADRTRWDMLVSRHKADGAFVYGVVTTGIYCRPGCPSKLPRQKNVRFFDTPIAAENAGFRPCKRCRPQENSQTDPHAEAIIRACQLIENAEESPTLAELASAVALSPAHFHRLFKARIGITPKQYAMEHRLNRARAALQASDTVTDAIYEAGFGSSSRFYQDATARLGMHPSEYRDGGATNRIRFAIESCDLGWVLVGATAKGICAVDFGDTPALLEQGLRERFPKAALVPGDPEFRAWVAQLLAYMETPAHHPDLPLDIQGTAFQRRVWGALKEIPPGGRATYGEIASRTGNPKAARAVARACATNPVAVVIPCHRVVRSDGALGGYRWGIERKRTLLEKEAEAKAESASLG